MKGMVQKRHWLLIWREFGWKKAFKVLFSSEAVALIILMEEEL
jgi:hypothetical protein